MKRSAHNVRALALAAALMILGLALCLPQFPRPDYSFSLHMGQHLLVQLVFPALLLLSLPELKQSGPAPAARSLKAPVICWLLGVGAMWFWHDPALCNAALRSPALHAVQLISSIVLGAAFWWPVLGLGPAHRLPPLPGIVYLFTACLGCTVLGIIISFAPQGLYLAAPLPGAFNDWQFASPADQRIGGLLMWVPACLIYVCGIMGLMARWYGAPNEKEIHHGNTTAPAH